MRSTQRSKQRTACAGQSGARRSPTRLIIAGCLVLFALGPGAIPARGQADLEEPLLPAAISEQDVEMRGRYARQWREDDGTLVVMFTGGFELDMGARHLRATTSVVWITRGRSPEGRTFHDLTVYLSEGAQVEEFGGTSIEDRILLVTNLRTYGRIAKYNDAHAPEVGAASPLYQQALRDRALIEAGPAPEEQEGPAVARPGQATARTVRPPRVIRYDLPSIEPAQTADGQLVYVVRATPERRVYFSREGGPDAPMLEILADNAVVFPGPRFARSVFADDTAGEAVEPAGPAPAPAPSSPAGAPAEAPPEDSSAAAEFRNLEQNVRGVYLEGDVLLTLGTSFVRASRLYYDFERDRALILDAVFRTDIPQRNIPLYVRADEIRQLSAREFSALHARVSTSEFYTPHYHVGVDRVVLSDLTTRDVAGRATGVASGEYELHNATVNVGKLPLLWWPYAQGRLEASETSLRRLRFGYSDRFGAELETSWYLFNLLNMPAPPGFDGRLRMDFFSDRGPGTGIDLDYQREDYFGLFRGYYINDGGEDTLGPLRASEEEPDSPNRGRVLWRHRHYMPGNWEATFELAYISDPNYLEEWEREEFNEGKQQETVIYLKRTGETDALTLLANWRLLDFVTQTEHLPDLVYRRIGDTFAAPFILYHESRVGAVRYRPDDRHVLDERQFSNEGLSDVTARGDARQEIELPLKLGPVGVVPFATFRGTYWDGSPLRAGGLWRGMGTYGLRSSTAFSRVFSDVESDLLDIHQIRHIVKPEFAAWWSHSNARSDLIHPFDYGIETIDEFYGAMAGIEQTWQTKRGGPDNWRSVDLFTLNLEVGAFGNTAGRDEESNGWVNYWRPENSRARNYFAAEAVYRLSDTTSLLYDFNLDLDDCSADRNNISLAVERSPRLAYIFGYRRAGDIDLNLVGGGWNYRLNEKHLTSFRAWYDIDRGDLGEVSLAYVKKLPRWYWAIAFEYDNIDDDFSISLSMWPEGVPEWTVGSRRFTGLTNSTGIRP